MLYLAKMELNHLFLEMALGLDLMKLGKLRAMRNAWRRFIGV